MATGNQNTFGVRQDAKFNIRIPTALRERVKQVSAAHKITQADVLRNALENYLPILEMLNSTKAENNEQS
jgi:predicted DNA-binding protein